MVAGLATLRMLTPEAYERLSSFTQRLGAELDTAFKESGVQAQITTVGSLFRIHFLSSRPRNYREAAVEGRELHRWLFLWLLNHGILWGNGGNVSLPMEEVHIDQLISSVKAALQDYRT